MLLNEIISVITEKKRISSFVLPTHKGKVILIKRTKDGTWGLPGGRVDKGEDAEEAAKRETEEEAGVDVDKVKKVGEYAVPRRRGLKRRLRKGKSPRTKTVHIFGKKLKGDVGKKINLNPEHSKAGKFKKSDLRKVARGEKTKIMKYDSKGKSLKKITVRLHKPIMDHFQIKK